MKKKLVVVLGPTASGKTDYAIERCLAENGEVISADSRQVYTGMDIGTAKVEDTRGVEHYLINIREPDKPLTLSEWQGLAYEAIEKILREGTQPFLVGGTMLYLDSIIFNYDIPNVAPDESFRREKAKINTEELYRELIEKDPKAATFIEQHHKQRIIRALEVMKSTGRQFSAIRRKREPRYDLEIVGLFPGWDELEKRIERRVTAMMDSLLKEAEWLISKYGEDLPLLKTINYAQAVEVLAGRMTKEEALAEMARANLKYAKRQMSWWRSREDIRWISIS